MVEQSGGYIPAIIKTNMSNLFNKTETAANVVLNPSLVKEVKNRPLVDGKINKVWLPKNRNTRTKSQRQNTDESVHSIEAERFVNSSNRRKENFSSTPAQTILQQNSEAGSQISQHKQQPPIRHFEQREYQPVSNKPARKTRQGGYTKKGTDIRSVWKKKKVECKGDEVVIKKSVCKGGRQGKNTHLVSTSTVASIQQLLGENDALKECLDDVNDDLIDLHQENRFESQPIVLSNITKEEVEQSYPIKVLKQKNKSGFLLDNFNGRSLLTTMNNYKFDRLKFLGFWNRSLIANSMGFVEHFGAHLRVCNYYTFQLPSSLLFELGAWWAQYKHDIDLKAYNVSIIKCQQLLRQLNLCPRDFYVAMTFAPAMAYMEFFNISQNVNRVINRAFLDLGCCFGCCKTDDAVDDNFDGRETQLRGEKTMLPDQLPLDCTLIRKFDKSKPDDCIQRSLSLQGLCPDTVIPIVPPSNAEQERDTIVNRVFQQGDCVADVAKEYVDFLTKHCFDIFGARTLIEPMEWSSWINGVNSKPSVKLELIAAKKELDELGIDAYSELTEIQLKEWCSAEAFVKQEKLLYSRNNVLIKNKTARLIQGSDAHFVVIVGPWMSAFNGYIKAQTSCSNICFASGKTVKECAEFLHVDDPGTLEENDFGKFDTSIRKEFLEGENVVFRSYGMPHAALQLCEYKAKLLRGVTANGWQYTAPPQRESGTVQTSLGNGIHNISSHSFFAMKANKWDWNDWRQNFRILVQGDDMLLKYNGVPINWKKNFALLGFDAEGISRIHNYEACFCSRRLLKGSKGWFFAPKIGRILQRIGFGLKVNPNLAGARYMKGVCLGLVDQCSAIPPLKSFLNRILELCGSVKPIYERDKPWEMIGEDVGEATEETWHQLGELYGWTMDHQRQFEAYLASIPRLGMFLHHPYLDQLILRDAGIDNELWNNEELTSDGWFYFDGPDDQDYKNDLNGDVISQYSIIDDYFPNSVSDHFDNLVTIKLRSKVNCRYGWFQWPKNPYVGDYGGYNDYDKQMIKRQFYDGTVEYIELDDYVRNLAADCSGLYGGCHPARGKGKNKVGKVIKKLEKKVVAKVIKQEMKQESEMKQPTKLLDKVKSAVEFGAKAVSVGKALYSGVRTIASLIGSGDYKLEQNSLFGMGVPEFTGKKSIRIRHSEPLAEVTGSVNFTVFDSWAVKPGSFPWLANIANNYEQYKFHGIAFELNSTSGESVASADTAIGSVLMADLINPADPIPTTRLSMLQRQNKLEGKPSDSMLFGVECKKVFNGGKLYVYDDGVLPVTETTHSVFVLATNGQQVDNYELGDLWVTYDVELFNAREPITPSVRNLGIDSVPGALVISGSPFNNYSLNPSYANNMNFSINSTQTMLTLMGPELQNLQVEIRMTFATGPGSTFNSGSGNVGMDYINCSNSTPVDAYSGATLNSQNALRTLIGRSSDETIGYDDSLTALLMVKLLPNSANQWVITVGSNSREPDSSPWPKVVQTVINTVLQDDSTFRRRNLNKVSAKDLIKVDPIPLMMQTIQQLLNKSVSSSIVDEQKDC